MAKKTAKATKTSKTKAYSPHDSLIIQLGVIMIIVAGIALFAYAYAQYAVK